MTQTNTTTIQSLQNDINQIDTDYNKTQIELLQKKVKDLEDETDDLRNRSMRSNLVILGIDEDEQDRRSTPDIVADFLVEHLDVDSFEEASHNIVRAHRGRRGADNRNRNRKGGRPIYVKFSRDDIAAEFLQRSIQNQITKKGFKVSQQFSPRLQERRNLALQKRRELLTSKQITKGYVEYPAVLKCIQTGCKEYTVIDTF